MAYALALLAACAFALGLVLQQKGTLEVPAAGDDPRFLAQILRRPVWLVGGAFQIGGWVLQAAALDRGSLIIVQSLTTMSLVIALPLGAHFTNQRITRRVVIGAIAMVAGIVLFLAVGSPQGGTSNPPADAWLSACLGALVIVCGLAWLGRHRQGSARALFYGSAAGVGFALQASVTKEFMTVIGNGLGAIFSSWTIYVLIISALAGFVLQQSALKTGVLAPAMASSNAVTLFASVIFGITIFDEKLSNGGGRLVPAAIGLGVALAGIALLAGAEPPESPAPATAPARPEASSSSGGDGKGEPAGDAATGRTTPEAR